jgi:hypothetical protein
MASCLSPAYLPPRVMPVQGTCHGCISPASPGSTRICPANGLHSVTLTGPSGTDLGAAQLFTDASGKLYLTLTAACPFYITKHTAVTVKITYPGSNSAPVFVTRKVDSY